MDFGVATCRGLSRRGACVLQARFAPLDPYPLDRLPSLYIYFEQPRGGPVQGTRFESCRYTSCAQTLYSTFLVKAAINDAAPQCFRSLDPGSLDHGNRLDTNRSGKPLHVFSFDFRSYPKLFQIASHANENDLYLRNRKHFESTFFVRGRENFSSIESRAARSRYNRRTRLLIPG